MTDQKLLGKVALITGAGSGIGAETAKLFTKLGATISILDLDENGLKSVAEECEALSTHGQPKPLVTVGTVTDAGLRRRYVADTVKAFSKIDILVNNAGKTKITTLADSTLEDFDELFDVNVKAVFHLTQLCLPHLKETKGAVVNISSGSAHTVVKGRMLYGMSKQCLNHFTKYAASELAEHQVRVNSISPGLIKTNIFLSYHIKKEELPERLELARKAAGLTRSGEPFEVAQLIAFLASDESAYITGTDVVIDGGLLVVPSAGTKVNK